MTLHDYEFTEDTSPRALDAQNEKIETAINVLKAEANSRKPSMVAELFDAAAEALQHEVK